MFTFAYSVVILFVFTLRHFLKCIFFLSDCVPDSNNLDPNSDMGRLVLRVRKTLQEAAPSSPNKPPPNYDLVHSKVTLQALGLQMGDKIVVNGVKVI